MNVQDECIKIHSKYGMSEMANYKIQLLFDSEIEKVKKEHEEKLRWIPVAEKLPEVKKGEAYSEQFLLKCKLLGSTKILLCVISKYGEYISEGLKCEILDPHYKPIEWRYFL